MTKTVPTNASNVLRTAAPTYDAKAKRILKDKQIAAVILKESYPEDFGHMSIKKIAKHITLMESPLLEDLEEEKDDQDPGAIEALDTEDLDTSGLVRFDVVFKIGNKSRTYIINMEMQQKFDCCKHVRRMIYYLSRLISRQKTVDFNNDHYENLKPVKQIWIFPQWKSKSGTVDFSFMMTGQFHLDEDTEREIRSISDHFLTSRFVFLNEKDYSQYKGSLIETLGEIFQNKDRDAAIKFLKDRKKVLMTVELINALKDYKFHPNVTYDEMKELEDQKDSELAAKDKELAAKENELAVKDIELAVKENELAAKENELVAKENELMEMKSKIYSIVKAMILAGDSSVEQISSITQIPVDQIERLKNELPIQ